MRHVRGFTALPNNEHLINSGAGTWQSHPKVIGKDLGLWVGQIPESHCAVRFSYSTSTQNIFVCIHLLNGFSARGPEALAFAVYSFYSL